jgi:Tol biopolymer transport system component
MDSGQTARITDLVEAPGDLTWSPDGTQLAFTAFVPAPPAPLAPPPAGGARQPPVGSRRSRTATPQVSSRAPSSS